MNKFLKKIFWFASILLLLFIVLILLPTTPRASKSLILSSLQKDSLMKNIASPRIIFIGGSNLSFGLNSQMIKDSLNLNPINTGIHASIGLIYMMNDALGYIKKNDTIILVPEYGQFYGGYAYGDEGQELTRIIFDANFKKLYLLNFKQLLNVFKMLPTYCVSKLKSTEYSNYEENNIYSVNSYNKFGDAYKHWGLEREVFNPGGNFDSTKFNIEVIKEIKNFQAEIFKKNAVLYLSYPGYQDSSYLNSRNQIQEIEKCFINAGFHTIGSPERYIMPDSMMFNTPYHLNKQGVDYRTKTFIDDFRKIRAYNKVHLP
jgi:hypothetical protein